jgi:hypothetical protein
MRGWMPSLVVKAEIGAGERSQARTKETKICVRKTE